MTPFIRTDPSWTMLLAMVVFGATTAPLAAQDRPLLLEAHGGVAIPTGSFADGDRTGEGASPGATLRIAFAHPRSRGAWTVYLGFTQSRFGCEDAGCAEDGRYVATGFDAGLRVAPFPEHDVVPWIRVGAITTRVETDDLPPPDAGLSDLGFGGEVGAGAYVGRNWSVALLPSVTWAAVNSTLPGGETLRLRYLTATLGVVFTF